MLKEPFSGVGSSQGSSWFWVVGSASAASWVVGSVGLVVVVVLATAVAVGAGADGEK